MLGPKIGQKIQSKNGVFGHPTLSRFDEELTQRRKWRLQQINIEHTPAGWRQWFRTGVRQKLAKQAWRWLKRGERLAGLAYCRTFSETIHLILSEPTDLIIAHTQPMLAPAYFAARKAGCLWGFDCEDILSEEYGEGIDNPHHQALVRYVEATFMPRTHYVTVASSQFVKWLQQHYGIADPMVVNNVPSLTEAPNDLVPGYPDARPHLSLHWFSQTIGSRRGIEEIIRALPHIEVPVQFHLRGEVLPGFKGQLHALVSELGVENEVFIHKRIAPHEAIRAAAQYDIGLVTNSPCCINHQLAVPNKLFACMMAGLAVAAINTEGQRSALAEAAGAGFTYEAGNVVELASRINDLAKHPRKLWAYRQRAFELAHASFNWEREQQKIVELVSSLEERVGRH